MWWYIFFTWCKTFQKINNCLGLKTRLSPLLDTFRPPLWPTNSYPLMSWHLFGPDLSRTLISHPICNYLDFSSLLSWLKARQRSVLYTGPTFHIFSLPQRPWLCCITHKLCFVVSLMNKGTWHSHRGKRQLSILQNASILVRVEIISILAAVDIP